MNKRKGLVVLFLIIASGALMAYFAEADGVTEGSSAVSFTETTMDSETLSLDDFRGKYILLDFWGSWCGPCHEDAPYLRKAYEQYNDRVEFIGIAVDNNREGVQEFIEKYNITWHQIQIPRNHPIPAKLVGQYNVNGYPTLFLIDPEGRIVINGNKESHRLRGEQLLTTLESIVEEK